jgi:hypothetical protein
MAILVLGACARTSEGTALARLDASEGVAAEIITESLGINTSQIQWE